MSSCYDEYSSCYDPHSQSYRRIDDQLQSLNLGQHYYGGHGYDYDYDSRRHNISGGGISSYGFGTAYGGSAQDYASNGGSNNTIAARGGYYGSGRGTYHDGSSRSNDYRRFGYYHHDGQPNFSDYGSSSHSSHPYGSSSHSSHLYPTSANSQPPLCPHSSSLEYRERGRGNMSSIGFIGFNNNSNSNMPEDLLIDILARLPVKSLLRFKCVSKYWYALIGSPDFISNHYHNCNNRAMLLVLRYVRYRNILSYPDPDRLSDRFFCDYLGYDITSDDKFYIVTNSNRFAPIANISSSDDECVAILCLCYRSQINKEGNHTKMEKQKQEQ
ncbi:hypothetical protein LguiB_031495 [Lonicera macranthoides]